ncbi:MAG: NosD domain-containing protein [Candidatus Woesearchaeota archaeon]
MNKTKHSIFWFFSVFSVMFFLIVSLSVFADEFGLSFYEPFENQSDVLNNSGIFYGSSIFTPGLVGNAINLSGNKRVCFPTVDNFDMYNGSIEMWVKPPNQNPIGFFDIGGLGSPNTLGIFKNGYLITEVKNNVNSFSQAWSTKSFNYDARWHHIAVVWTRIGNVMNFKTCFDGNCKTSYDGSIQNPFLNSTPFCIGWTGWYGYSNSIIDEVKIYNYVKSDSQIKNDYSEFKNITLWDFTSKECVMTKSQSLGNVVMNCSGLYVNNSKFLIKGVGYQPIPIGRTGTSIPDKKYFYDNSKIYQDRDFPLLRKMNVNAIRTWDEVRNISFLDAAYNNGSSSIYVIMGFWINCNEDWGNALIRQRYIDNFTSFVNNYKNNPAVLMWALGNENNLGYCKGSYNIANFYSLCNELSRVAYEVEGENYHPVGIINGDLGNIGLSDFNSNDEILNYTDYWGSNVYPGETFGYWFNEYRALSGKPLYISEYGIDAFDNLNQKEYESVHAEWVKNQWLEINASNVTIGSTVMEYSDEWWKSGSFSTHDNGGYVSDRSPDNYGNEEWWGVMRTVKNGTNIDVMRPRQVYYTLRDLFRGYNNNPQIGNVKDIIVFEEDTINLNLTFFDVDGDDLLINYSYPFNSFGVFNTKKGDANNYSVIVTASDGSKNVNVTFNVNVLEKENCIVPYSEMILSGNNSFCAGTYDGLHDINFNNSAILDCQGSTFSGSPGYVLFSLASVNNVTLKNCHIYLYQYGVYLSSSNSNVISDVTCTANVNYCVYLNAGSNFNIISNNELSNTFDSGLTLIGSHNNAIVKNIMTGNRYRNGIHLENSNNNLIFDNYISGNGNTGTWYYKGGIALISSYNNKFINNTIVSNSDDGIYTSDASNTILEGNIISNNAQNGIIISGSNVTLRYNNITENSQDGIFVGVGGDLQINYNSIFSNVRYDFFNNVVQNTDAKNNWWGTTNCTLFSLKIFDKTDDSSKGIVYFSPILDSFYPTGSNITFCDYLLKLKINIWLPIVDDPLMNEGDVLNFYIDASSSSGINLTYKWYVDSVLQSSVMNVFDYSPDYFSNGLHSIYVNISDGVDFILKDWDVMVNNVNRMPVLDFVGNKTVAIGNTLTFNLSAIDADLNVVTFSKDNSVGTLIGNVFTFTPSVKQNEIITFTVSDGSLFDDETIFIIVNDCVDLDGDSVCDYLDNCIGQNVTNVPIDTFCALYSFNSSNGCHVTNFKENGYVVSQKDCSLSSTTCKLYSNVDNTCDGSGNLVQGICAVWNNNDSYSKLIDCASDRCSGKDWLDYADDGNDVCVSGEVVSYECIFTSSYSTSCDDDWDNDGDSNTNDCEPNDGTIYHGNSNLAKNCVNDAPSLSVSGASVAAGEIVTINPVVSDPDGDSVIVSYIGWMNSNSKSTSLSDVGAHIVTVTASDGSLQTSKDITVMIIDSVDLSISDVKYRLMNQTLLIKMVINVNSASDVNGVTYKIIGFDIPINYYIQRMYPGKNTVWTAKDNVLPGHYDLTFEIDSDKIISETTEGNNVYTTGVDAS